MKSEPPTPTGAPDNQFRNMEYQLNSLYSKHQFTKTLGLGSGAPIPSVSPGRCGLHALAQQLAQRGRGRGPPGGGRGLRRLVTVRRCDRVVRVRLILLIVLISTIDSISTNSNNSINSSNASKHNDSYLDCFNHRLGCAPRPGRRRRGHLRVRRECVIEEKGTRWPGLCAAARTPGAAARRAPAREIKICLLCCAKPSIIETIKIRV